MTSESKTLREFLSRAGWCQIVRHVPPPPLGPPEIMLLIEGALLGAGDAGGFPLLVDEILRLSAENADLGRLLREVEEGGCLDAGEQYMEPEDVKEIRAIAWECRDEETDDD